MARTLTDLQLPSTTSFYQQIQSIVASTVSYEARLSQVVEFLSTLTVEDLDAIGVPATGSDFGLRTDLVTLRSSLTAIQAEIALHKTILDALRPITTL